MLSRREVLKAAAVVPGAILAATERAIGAGTAVPDLVVYGATPGGIIAAIEGASHGLKTIIVGGWRETHLGGMLSGGLGRTDYLDIDAFGGRARDFLARVSRLRGEPPNLPHSPLEGFFEESAKRFTGAEALASRLGMKSPPRSYFFEPKHAESAFSEMVQQAGIPVYWTRGVDIVQLQDSRISQFSTVDGQTFRGRVFVDASYEGDLLARAGVKYEVGRGPANEDNDLDGFRGLDRGAVQPAHGQYFAGGSEANAFRDGIELDVDPFVEPGNPASGLIPYVRLFPDIVTGAADSAVQAYNFRITMTDDLDRMLTFSEMPPHGYEKSQYEVLFRYLAAATVAGTPLMFRDLIILGEIGPRVYDANARRGFSTDAVGLNWDYPEASYAERERIWKAHERYIRGFFYALQHEDDPRVSGNMRREARWWGLDGEQFTRPHSNDDIGWPYQLYVREARRMVGDIQWTGADLVRLDGFPPRSSKVIALASYRQDSHQTQRLAYKDPKRGVWRLWNEGGFEAAAGGRDLRSPLPLEIILPRKQDCTNLLVTFCVSATHQAFSAIRMELCSMALGQAAGAAAALACLADRQMDLHDLDYGKLRGLLLRGDQMIQEKFPPLWALQWGGGAVALASVIGTGVAYMRKRRVRVNAQDAANPDRPAAAV